VRDMIHIVFVSLFATIVNAQSVPSLPPLPTSYKFVIEVNEFTHNTSFAMAFYKYGGKARIEYRAENEGDASMSESPSDQYVDIADNAVARRYQFSADPSACVSVPISSTNLTFGGEPMPPPSPTVPVPWDGVEDDDDDLIEAFFYGLGMNGSTLYDIFIGSNHTMDVFVGNVNVRGVRCNCWQKQLTMMPIPMWDLVTDVQLLVDVFVTAEVSLFFLV
jgi:hypothetical protein